jgi:hypothetical protein
VLRRAHQLQQRGDGGRDSGGGSSSGNDGGGGGGGMAAAAAEAREEREAEIDRRLGKLYVTVCGDGNGALALALDLRETVSWARCFALCVTGGALCTRG